MTPREEGFKYRIEQCEEKIRNTREMKKLSNTAKIEGSKLKRDR